MATIAQPQMMVDPAPPTAQTYQQRMAKAQTGAPQNLAAATGRAPVGTPGATTPPATTTVAQPASPIGNAPPWLKTQSVTPYKDGPGVTLTNVDYSDLAPIPTDFGAEAAKGAEAAYKGATQFFDQDFGRDTAALENQLVNQGFARGSEGFDAEMEKLMRSQNAARENAAFMAQGVGHQQAGDLLQRALAARAATVGERANEADRTYNQSMGVANLNLGRLGQTTAAKTAANTAAQSLAASTYATDTNAEIALRNLGLQQGSQEFNQAMQLLGAARGGVNMPNFGSPAPIDVGSANQIASANANTAANRAASDRAGLYGLGAAALGAVGNYYGGYG